jgi:folylpolyglutamate synthase/dihydropteroate synthase
VVDGAHNPDSMSKLMQAMNNLFYQRKMIVVLGMSSDKDIVGIVAELGKGPDNVLGPRVGKVIVTRSRHPRAADPNEVAATARARGLFTETREESSEAIATAIESARAGGTGGPDDPVVLVTGSLFVVAEAREAFGLAPDLSEEGD